MLSDCGFFQDPTTSSVSCDPNCNTTVTEKTVAVGGKLAQSYVKDARVWADRLVNGEGDLKWQNEEPLAVSDSQGGYQLSGITGEYQLVAFGGEKLDSKGNPVDAIPMVAPAPEAGQTKMNVTPLTTLVTFEPSLKAKLSAYGDWNADIASPSGINSNLLRIAKTVETLSSVVSGGSSPLISDFNDNLKSVGILASQLNSTSGDLANDTVLKASASTALTKILSDSTLVPNRPSNEEQATLVGSLEQAVQGITDAIPANAVVVEDSTLLSKIETVLDAADVDGTVSLTLNMGNGETLNFGAIITEIKMDWIANSLVLTAKAPDDDTNSLEYNWSTTSSDLNLTNSTEPTAKVFNFYDTEFRVSLTIIDTAAGNFTDTAYCTWESNPTICCFLADDKC